MDKQTALQSLTAEKQAYIAFVELKIKLADWVEVSSYAQKILIVDEKIRLLKSINEIPNGVPDAQALIQQEARQAASKLKARRPKAPQGPVAPITTG